MQDTVYAHPFLQRAARGSISIFLHLIDSPEDIDGFGDLPAADRKKEKAKLKKRKEKEIKLLEEKEKLVEEEAKWSGKESSQNFDDLKDSDPFGEKILQKNYLAECSVWCNLIAPFHSNNISFCDTDTLALVCDVMIRKTKYVPAVRALSIGLKKSPNHPALSVLLVKFAAKVGGGASAVGITSPVDLKLILQSVVYDELTTLLGGSGVTLQSYSEKYMKHCRHSNSIDCRIAGSKISMLVDKSSGKANAIQLLTEENMWSGRGLTVVKVLDAMIVSYTYVFYFIDLFCSFSCYSVSICFTLLSSIIFFFILFCSIYLFIFYYFSILFISMHFSFLSNSLLP